MIPCIVQTTIRCAQEENLLFLSEEIATMHVVAFSASVTNWAHSAAHTPWAPCRVGAMSSGTTSQVRAASLFLFLLLLLLPLNEHPAWCAAGDVVVALTISIFTPAGATDAMPLSRASAYSPLLSFSSLLLYPCLSSRRSICYKLMDTLHRRSQRRASVLNCASASGDSV